MSTIENTAIGMLVAGGLFLVLLLFGIIALGKYIFSKNKKEGHNGQ